MYVEESLICSVSKLTCIFRGSADYNHRKGVFCVDDPFQGTVLYRADTEARIRTFEVKITKPATRPRQVCFADDCSSVVSGSDHGVVYVFDRRTGQITDMLHVDPSDWVQTVTVSPQCEALKNAAD